MRRSFLYLTCLVSAFALACDDDPDASPDAEPIVDYTLPPIDAEPDAGPDPDAAEMEPDADPDVGGPEFDAAADMAEPDMAPPPEGPECQRIADGYGPDGEVQFDVEVVARGLSIPWGIGWLPDGDMIVTERGGDLSRIDADGQRTLLAEVDITPSGEGGLLGLALHPDFAANRWIYLYYTTGGRRNPVNIVERWVLAEDGQSAEADRIIVDDIPALQFHNGGRIRFGPDGHLYIGTGDAGVPDISQDVDSTGGKLLRVTDEGEIPADNPFPDSATWVYGIRNTQGFDWLPDGRIVITDHGPSGLPAERGRTGHDEITVARPGDNLGWPDIYACEERDGMLSPSMTWRNAMPPGGTAIYTGDEIPEWQGDVFIGVLGFGDAIGHLHRIGLAEDGGVEISEVYLQGADGFGRLREVVMGPDGGLYATSSGCDGRGSCGDGDVIIRIGRR